MQRDSLPLFGEFMDSLLEQKPKKRRVMAHVSDAGPDAIEFECSRCGWNSGWINNEFSISQAKRGIPCWACNKGDADGAK